MKQYFGLSIGENFARLFIARKWESLFPYARQFAIVLERSTDVVARQNQMNCATWMRY